MYIGSVYAMYFNCLYGMVCVCSVQIVCEFLFCCLFSRSKVFDSILSEGIENGLKTKKKNWPTFD